jgi:hypothetical protein
VTSSAFVGICERADAVIEPGGVILTLVVQDVDGWYTHFLSKGVLIEKPPAVNDTYGIIHFFANDPNGYLIEVQRFLDPNWNISSCG